MTSLRPFSSDGHSAVWSTWDGDHVEEFTLTWENEAWTASGRVGREDVQYVMRLSPLWHVRQFLLFRDLDEPDLWLAIDARHRWGEVNGTYRPELDGHADIELPCSPFGLSLPIRRLGLDQLGFGEAAELPVITVDVETLAADPVVVRYEHLAPGTWRRVSADGTARDFTVDELGLVVTETGRFRRAA